MNKIEEMAAEYKKMHPSATTFGNKEVNREVEYAYIDGANAVLREIRKVMTYEHYNEYRRTHYAPDENKFFRFEVVHKIQELKGK